MSNVASVDLQKVFAALGREPRLQGISPDDLDDAKNIISLLPDAIGDRMNDIVTVEGFFLVTADFFRAILDTPFDLYYQDEGYLRSEFEQREAELRILGGDVPMYLAEVEMTEAEVLGSDDFQFNAQVKRLIKKGQLTFHHVLHLQPAIFLPQMAED